MFKKFLLPLVIAAVIAAMLAMASDQRGFEELAVRAAIADEARAQGTKCPLSQEYTDKGEIGLLSICLKYGLGAFEAAQRYPATAAKVFAVYGEDETFQKVLDRYGHQVIPVVAYFVENGSREFQIRQALGDALQKIWEGKKPKWQLADITREQIGLIAIYHLEHRGHEMLAEFEIINGVAKRKPLARFFLGAKELLLGGVGDIETILVRGERLPTWKEVGFAALDVTIVAGGVGAVAKATRLGVGAAETVEKSTVRLAAEGAAEKNTIRVAAEGAYEAISAVGKTGVLVAPIAFAYVAITRPQLIASAGGWVAEQLGGNRWVGIFAVYLIGMFLVLQFLRPLLWCGRIVGKPIFRLARHASHKGAACPNSALSIVCASRGRDVFVLYVEYAAAGAAVGLRRRHRCRQWRPGAYMRCGTGGLT
jgi:hypothetical protein